MQGAIAIAMGKCNLAKAFERRSDIVAGLLWLFCPPYEASANSCNAAMGISDVVRHLPRSATEFETSLTRACKLSSGASGKLSILTCA